MSIVCGTDFSDSAQRAIRVAVELAQRHYKPLHLVHAMQIGAGELEAEPKSEVVRWAERQLERAAARVRERGVEVTTHLLAAAPDEALIAQAVQCRAELIVVGALGHRARGPWQLGSHADRLAQRSHVPVLVVRQSEPFEAWLDGKRPLRVVLGAELSRSTEFALENVKRLRRLAPCDVTAVHLYWPPQEFRRLGLDGVRSYLDPDPEVTKTLERDLKHRLASAEESDSIYVHVEPHLGRFGDRLAAVASERGAELLVVGSHERSVFGRVWEASVARGALHASSMSVLVVPPPPSAAQRVTVPRLRNVLAATDFSAEGNAAIGLAFAVAEPGATIHIAHVMPAQELHPLAPHDVFALEQTRSPRRVEVHAALTALVPPDVQHPTRFYALESNEPASAICQAALRVDADVICLGHRGRSNLANAILGSVAKDVLAQAERPVLLARKPRE